MTKYPDKVALVFGGSRGIGAATVARLTKDGFKVAFTFASREDKAAEVAAASEAARGEALAIKADSTDHEQILAAVEQAVARLGTIDVLVATSPEPA